MTSPALAARDVVRWVPRVTTLDCVVARADVRVAVVALRVWVVSLIVARGITFCVVRAALVVVRSTMADVRDGVVAPRLRTVGAVCVVPVFVRVELVVVVPRLDVVACVDARRTAARATSPISSACAPANPMNARHPAKISPNFFILCN